MKNRYHILDGPIQIILVKSMSTELYKTVFKLRSMFYGQMSVKIIDSTQVTIQPYVYFNLVVYRPSFQKIKSLTWKIFL